MLSRFLEKTLQRGQGDDKRLNSKADTEESDLKQQQIQRENFINMNMKHKYVLYCC